MTSYLTWTTSYWVLEDLKPDLDDLLPGPDDIIPGLDDLPGVEGPLPGLDYLAALVLPDGVSVHPLLSATSPPNPGLRSPGHAGQVVVVHLQPQQ